MLQRKRGEHWLRGKRSSSVPPLAQLEPETVRRLTELEETGWGRHRYAPDDELLPPIPLSGTASRLTGYLEALYRGDAAGTELAPILLNGLAAGYGTADLANEERRLTVHHLELIARRYRTFRAEVLEALDRRTFEARRASHRRNVQEPASPLEAMPRETAEFEARADARRLIARCWTVYRTWLELREEGARLTGAPDDESFQGIRRAGATPLEQNKAHLWYELADLVFLGVQQRLMRLTLQALGEAIATGRVDWLLETWSLALLFGEGRSYQRISALVRGLLPVDVADGFERAGLLLADCAEETFRQSTAPRHIDPRPLSAALEALRERWPSVTVPVQQELEWLCIATRQAALLEAEQHLEAVIGSRAHAEPRRDPAAWERLVRELQALTTALEAHALSWEELARRRQALRTAIDAAAAHAATLPEYRHWPGDGEEYRVRRQRSAAPGDRLYHLIGLAERFALALELVGNDPEAARHDQPPWELFRRCLEEDEACIFVEEWTSRFGPRLETVFGRPPGTLRLEANRQTQAIDLTVRMLVQRARDAGGDPCRWGWLFCGVTDRLREAVRRLGPDHPFVHGIEGLLEAGDLEAAEQRTLRVVLPGAEPGDQDAFVTVGVHVFNADTRIVRENLLHDKHLSWPLERLWVLLGSSSADRSIAERERQICLETGTTHYFIAARRHQKAGNQNRVIPNVPASPRGKTFYLTLDDDYLAGSQTLHRLVPLAERHPEAAFVQLPLYLFGNHLPGISRARHADAAGMVVWGSITSLGIRDLRLVPGRFADRRSLALPFGTCTLFRLTPGATSLEDTSGFYTDSVCEDFAQGLLAFSLKHMHYPRPPLCRWDDGILLDEIWIEGDGVELYGRIRQQTRWCEGSTRNAWRIWLPAVKHYVKQRTGLAPLTGERPPSFPQLAGGTAMVLGYPLEFLGMMLFMVAFPLTAIMAEPAPTLGHSIAFWATLWTLHLSYSFYLALHCGLSLRTFLDQHFIRFSAISGMAEGLYRSVRAPSTTWSACKDARVRLPVRHEALFLGFAALNLAGAVVGTARGMPIYLLCLITVVTALWQFLLRQAVPIQAVSRIRNLPRGMPAASLAWRAFQRESAGSSAQGHRRPIPFGLAATLLLLALTVTAMAARYHELAPLLPHLLHEHPLFFAWLLGSDTVQVLALSWIWLFTACGLRNRGVFTYEQLIAAGRARELPEWDPLEARRRADRLRPVGLALAWLVGRRPLHPAPGFLAASGAWLAIAIVALGLRIPHLDANGAFMDESYYIVAGRRFLAGESSMPVAWAMFGSYLYPLLTAMAEHAGGLEASRLLSMLFGAITALAIGQIAHRLAGHAVGMVAAMCAAVAYQSVYISTLATYDAASVAGVAVSAGLLAGVLWGRDARRLSEGQRLRRLVGSSLALLFGILAKYVAVIFVPGMLATVLLWSLPRPFEGRNLAGRAAAWALPLVLGLGIYGVVNREVLAAWWTYALNYQALVSTNTADLLRIYLLQGWNIPLAAALAVGGIVWAWGSSADGSARDSSPFVADPSQAVGDPSPNPLPVAGRGLMKASSPFPVEAVELGLGMQDPTCSHSIAGEAERSGTSRNDGQDAPPLKGKGPGERSRPRDVQETFWTASVAGRGLEREMGSGTVAGTGTGMDPDPIKRCHVRSARWAMGVLAMQVLVFAAFQAATRADINYLKHVNYAFPFLLPLTALGLFRLAEGIRDRLSRHGLSLGVSRALGTGVILAVLVLLGLHQVDVLDGALRWWPDPRPYAAALETGLRDGDRILIDDTGLEYYTLEHKVSVDTPFYATYAGLEGIAAAREGVRRQAYDVVILDGGITGEGRALHSAVASEVYPAGYRRVYVPPGSPPFAGVYVAPRAEARFQDAEVAGEAWEARRAARDAALSRYAGRR